MEGHQHNKVFNIHFMARYWLFKSHFNHEQESLPGLSPGMPWPAATYAYYLKTWDSVNRHTTNLLIYVVGITNSQTRFLIVNQYLHPHLSELHPHPK